MTSPGRSDNVRNFTLSTEIFETPNLDIYAQMACIVLHSYSSESAPPSLSEIARQGRMNTKQATKALQALVDLNILPHKVYREIIGEFADDRLSWAAKGLLVFCRKSPNTTFDELIELSSQSGEDQRSIRRALDELRRYGYLDDLPQASRLLSYLSDTGTE